MNDSLQFLKSIQYNASHGIIATTSDGMITNFNKKAEDLLGYDAEDIIGKQNPGIFHDLDEVIARTKKFNKKLNLQLEPGFDTFVCHTNLDLKNEFEWTYVHKDGTRFPVLLSITAIKNNLGEVTGYLGLVQDLTDQKILEKELTKKNNELRLAQSISKIGSWSFNIEKNKIFWSQEMYNIFPENIEDGEPDFEKHKATIHKEDVEYWQKTVEKCFLDGTSYTMQFRTYRKDNHHETVWIEARGQAHWNFNKITSISGTCQDITERVKKEIELERHAKELELAEKKAKKAEKSKSEFLANMSHEIRTPMNGIIGMLQLLGETETTDEQKEMLNTLSLCSENLLNLLSDILDISKVDAGKLKLEEVNFDINLCIENICTLMNTKARENRTLIKRKFPLDQANWFMGDITRIRQILMNYVTNAIKFTKDGYIEIDYKVKPFNSKKSILEISVKDTGIGISKSDQDKLFKDFSQADTSITRKYGGTGLGLSICSKLAKLMNGKVYFESEPGVGSTFYLEVKLKNGAPRKVEEKDKENNENLSIKYPHNIILAEDNKINQKVASMILQKLGYICDIANNGLEVLELLESKKSGYYSLILMDMQMPEMDGITATKNIILKYHEAPKIIALTANAFNSDKKLCLEAGMVDFLSKPLKKEELISKLIKYY